MHSPATKSDLQCRTPAAVADRLQDLVASPAAGACLGATLCLLAMRRVRGLDLLLGAAGAGLLYRALSQRGRERGGETRGRSVRPGQGLARTDHSPSVTPAADEVDEASEASFPGSDPPAFTGTSASRAGAD